jgi:hypothetical protein
MSFYTVGGEHIKEINAINSTVEGGTLIRFKTTIVWPNPVRFNLILMGFEGIPDCTGQVDTYGNLSWDGPVPSPFLFSEYARNSMQSAKFKVVTSGCVTSQDFIIRLSDAKGQAITLTEGWKIIWKLDW